MIRRRMKERTSSNMNLDVKSIDVIIKALTAYLYSVIDGEDDFLDIAMVVLQLLKEFRSLRRSKLGE